MCRLNLKVYGIIIRATLQCSIAACAMNMAHAAPLLPKTAFISDDKIGAVSLGYLSSTVPLESLSLVTEQYDLDRECIELSLSENGESGEASVYLTLSHCMNEEAVTALSNGSGLGGSFGVFFESKTTQGFIEVAGARTNFDNNQADYEISRGAIIAGFYVTPFNRKRSNTLMKNFSVGFDYSFNKIREKLTDGDELTRSESGGLVSDLSLLVRWSYSFHNNFGVSFSGSFIGREEMGAQLYVAF